MTSKTELKKMIEALREEIRGLRLDVANLQTMIRNQNTSTSPASPYTTTPMTAPSYPTITCSTDTCKNDDGKIITAVN